MPEINKPTGLNKIWANTGSIAVPTDSKLSQGWVEEIPPHEYENYIQNRQDLAIAHINQHGIPMWDAVTEYQAGKSYVMGSNGKVYFALNTHTNRNPVTDTSNISWVDVNSKGYVVLTSTTSWSVPAVLRMGLKTAKVIIQAGGGSGGSGSGSVATGTRGAGGGAGGYAQGYIDLTNVQSVAVTVGTGGARSVSPSTSGQAGGTTSFGSYMSAVGGGPGIRYNSTTAASGGYGGSSTGGQLNLKGGDGSDGPIITGNSIGGSGDGGASFFGGGSRGSTSFIATIPAYGAGGGGGVTGSNPGGPGVVIIEW